MSGDKRRQESNNRKKERFMTELKKTLKTLAAWATTGTILFSMSAPVFADGEKKLSDNLFKISEELQGQLLLQPHNADGTYPVCIWIEDVDLDEIHRQTMERLDQNTRFILEQSKWREDVAVDAPLEKDEDFVTFFTTPPTNEQLQLLEASEQYQITHCQVYREVMGEKMSRFLEQADLQESVSDTDTLSPMMLADLTKEQIYRVANETLVNRIGYFPNLPAAPESETVSPPQNWRRLVSTASAV